MLDPLVRLAGELWASNHKILILDDDYFPDGSMGLSKTPNGLAATVPGILAIRTGIHMGPVELTIERYTEAPSPEVDAWEDVVEMSIEAPVGTLRACAPEDDVPTELDELVTADAGWYRVRVHARGRDQAVDLSVLDPVEAYLVQLWPDSATAESVTKMASSYGRGWYLSDAP